MPYSYVQRPLTSGTPQTVPFPYLAREHVKLFRNYNLVTGAFEQLLTQGVHYDWINNFSISLSGSMTGVLTILRATPTEQRMVDWANGSNLTAEPLDTADLQVFYAFQELYDRGVISGIAAADALATTSYALSVENVAAIPATPATGLLLEVRDSTGIQSLAIAGMPANFEGSSSLSVRIRRTALGWSWDDYRPDDPDGRYVKQSDVTSSLSTDEPQKVLSAAGATQLRRLIYTPVANKESLPTQPQDAARFILLDSTGIELPPPAGMPTGFVGEPGLRVQIVRSGQTWVWDGYEANNPDGRYRVRRGQSLATLTLAAGATASATITLPRSCQLISAAASKAAWIRIYSSQAAASADASRLRTQAPALGSGIISDPVITSQPVNFEPVPCAINRETPPANAYPIRITNDGTAGAMTITIEYLSLEP
jgi:hypothetical protein